MSKAFGLLALLAVASLALGPSTVLGASQDMGGGMGGGGGEPKAGPCDVKTTEAANWCEKGDGGGHLVEKDKLDKDGKCKEHGEAVKKIELCVKKFYACGCPGGNCCKDESDKPGKCKCKKPLAEKTDKCKAVWVCEGCEAKALLKDDVKHDEEKHKDPMKKKDVKKSCEKSGSGWHVTK